LNEGKTFIVMSDDDAAVFNSIPVGFQIIFKWGRGCCLDSDEPVSAISNLLLIVGRDFAGGCC
jgi:hypothetical protein